MGQDAGASIAELRRQLEHTDDDTRYAIETELQRRHRAVALTPRPRPDRAMWRPIPRLHYRRSAVGWTDERLRDELKLFMRVLATVVAATLGELTPEQGFVVLLHYERTPEEIDLTVTCPYTGPVDALRALVDGSRDPELVFLELAQRLNVEHRYGILDGATVPVVVVLPQPGRVLLMNQTHLRDPAQFVRAELCTTTSGFLNFLGALCIGTGEPVMFTDIDLLPDDSLGEWKRWFYAHLDSGIAFDADRLLVDVHNAERYAYDYQKGDEQ